MALRSFLNALRLRSKSRALRGEVVPLTIYTRPGCHLCEDLERELEDVRLSFDFVLTRIDIDGDPDLTRSYGDRIPVLEVGGRVALAGVVREGTLVPRLTKLARRYLEVGRPQVDADRRTVHPDAE